MATDQSHNRRKKGVFAGVVDVFCGWQLLVGVSRFLAAVVLDPPLADLAIAETRSIPSYRRKKIIWSAWWLQFWWTLVDGRYCGSRGLYHWQICQ